MNIFYKIAKTFCELGELVKKGIYKLIIWAIKLNGKKELEAYECFNIELNWYINRMNENKQINEYTVNNFEKGMNYIEEKKVKIEIDFVLAVKTTQIMSNILLTVIYPIAISKLNEKIGILNPATIISGICIISVIIGSYYMINEAFNILMEKKKIEMEYKYSTCKNMFNKLKEEYNKNTLLSVFKNK